jgi:TonB family protein
MKKFYYVFLTVFLVVLIGVAAVGAQETPKAVKGGILNGRAIKLPAPAYPEAAKLENAGGPVSVAVTVDEEGNVIDAVAATEITITADDNSSMEAKPIHPALREAAEKAAREAKFSPTKLSGQPVRVSGTITYNFVAGSPPEQDRVLRPIDGRVINGRAITLPKPAYPSAAAEARVTGAVNIQVSIDEAGNVITATVASGHPLLSAPAVEAAREAKFSPTRLSGQPVKITGILTYYFKADGEWYTGETAPEAPVDGGVVNSKATSFPMPAYPPAARAVRAGGAVSVHVVIDEQGNVVTAMAVSGNPLLRSAAVTAAQDAKFSPTLLEGKPITVTGILVYNFVADDGYGNAKVH